MGRPASSPMEGKTLDMVVLLFSGEQREQLLQGITSNTLDASQNAFLDRMGKIVAFFFQKRSPEGVYAAVARPVVQRLESHLAPYLRLSKAQMRNTGLKAIHVLEEPPGLSIPLRVGWLALTAEMPGLEELSDEVYDALRIEHGISLQGRDFDDEMLLETNWDDAVSYTKGCYLGQEIICRVHSLGAPAKKLVRAAFSTLPEGVTYQGRPAGELRSSAFSPRLNKYVAFIALQRGATGVDGGELLDVAPGSGGKLRML